MSTFWERRKAGVEAEARAEEKAKLAALQAEREAEQAEKSDEELLEELDLPDPDTLTEGDDFKQFLIEAVPARLKTRALRRLWRVNPVLANLDGLLDYGEDFTDSAMVVENLQTAYQVGKGMLKHVEEMARKAEKLDPSEEESVDGAETETEALAEDETLAPDLAGDETVALVEEETGIAEVSEDALPNDVEPAEMPARTSRRMTFTFEDQGA